MSDTAPSTRHPLRQGLVRAGLVANAYKPLAGNPATFVPAFFASWLTSEAAPAMLATWTTRTIAQQVRRRRRGESMRPAEAAGLALTVAAGVGAVGVALIGMTLFGESASPARVACLLMIVAGVAGLKLLSR